MREQGQERPTWQQLLEEGTRMLSAAGVPDAGTDAWYLLSEVFKIDRVHYYMEQNRPVRQERYEEGYERYRELLKLRASRIPLQQILGNQDFMGMTFCVDENVLIPRQDTETLVEAVLEAYPERDLSILDMCTGTGCIAISLAVLGKYRSVTAADISREALRVARKNARRLFLVQKGTVRSASFQVSEEPWRLELKNWTISDGHPGEIDERCLTLLAGNLFENIASEEMFDVIVSNPPYIPSAVIDGLEPEVRDHEPRLALDGREDGLYFYRVLALECSRHLRTGGQVFFEIGCDQAEEVRRILTIAGYREIEIIKDEPGLDRVVRARWNR